MKDSKSETIIGMLAFIWSSVETNKAVSTVAAVVGLIWMLAAAVSFFLENKRKP